MTQTPEQIAARHPLDECECGDYRRDHLNGTGPCTFNKGAFDLTHGGRDCLKFRAILEKQHDA